MNIVCFQIESEQCCTKPKHFTIDYWTAVGGDLLRQQCYNTCCHSHGINLHIETATN